jgi:hypothetical protein
MAPRFGSGFFNLSQSLEEEELDDHEQPITAVAPTEQQHPPPANLQGKRLDMEYITTFLKFAVMGAGANWVYPSALAQEIPYFQRTQPEGLCVATYMNATTNLGLLAVITYFTIIRFFGPIPHSYAVPMILFFSAFGSYLSAVVYSVTVNGSSMYLFLCCAIGGAVGALSSVVMNPFLTNYQNDFISASRTGGSACILLSAMLALIQSPGSVDSTRFTPHAYMLTFAVILSFPIFSYRHIVRNGIGLRSGVFLHDCVSRADLFDLEAIEGAGGGGSSGSGNGSGTTSDTKGGMIRMSQMGGRAAEGASADAYGSPAYTTRRQRTGTMDSVGVNVGLDIDSDTPERHGSSSGTVHPRRRTRDDSDDINSSSSSNGGSGSRTRSRSPAGSRTIGHTAGLPHPSHNPSLDSYGDSSYHRGLGLGADTQGDGDASDASVDTHPYSRSRRASALCDLLAAWLPRSLTNHYPWLVNALPLCLVVGVVNFNTWGMITALSPFAFSNASFDVSGGAASLALAYELGACVWKGGTKCAHAHVDTYLYAVTLHCVALLSLVPPASMLTHSPSSSPPHHTLPTQEPCCSWQATCPPPCSTCPSTWASAPSPCAPSPSTWRPAGCPSSTTRWQRRCS